MSNINTFESVDSILKKGLTNCVYRVPKKRDCNPNTKTELRLYMSIDEHLSGKEKLDSIANHLRTVVDYIKDITNEETQETKFFMEFNKRDKDFTCLGLMEEVKDKKELLVLDKIEDDKYNYVLSINILYELDGMLYLNTKVDFHNSLISNLVYYLKEHKNIYGMGKDVAVNGGSMDGIFHKFRYSLNKIRK